MDFIEDHPFHISYEVCTFIQHAAQNFCRHNQAARFWIDLDITREDANILRSKRLLEISIFLI